MKIINNCLNKEEFINVKNLLIDNNFPWYLNEVLNKKVEEEFQFTHTFYDNFVIKSDYFNYLNNILLILKPKALIRIKANLLTKTNEIIEHGYHVDTEANTSKTAILYINTNNGYTKFKDGELIKSEENKLIIFDSDQEHTGTTCTDKLFRMVINFVYID
jgi:hypothetical protein